MTVSMHPPVNPRCQIYVTTQGDAPDLFRCLKDGTHWEKWCSCGCIVHDPAVCDGDYHSWECDGDHAIEEALCA